ncbi:MAG: diaminopimelate epimerase [Bacillota bacterium]|nr:diaminopimelate epimerase [Bacillota bacterium]
MDFVKMHGLGNDFIIVEVPTWESVDKLQSEARWMCDRNFGIGADGLVMIGKDPELDVFMRIFNSDGTEPEMCGNAIRCIAKYAYENELTDKRIMAVRTLAGVRNPELIMENGSVSAVRVDMGEPILERSLIPMSGDGSNVNIPIHIEDQQFNITAVSVGNSHCVIFVDDINQVLVDKWGPQLEVNPLFPAKTNVEFVQVISENELIMRVWERGAGITLACGTGSCATLVASILNGYTKRAATIHLLGGDLFIEWENDQHVYMTGPATEVFKGTL